MAAVDLGLPVRHRARRASRQVMVGSVPVGATRIFVRGEAVRAVPESAIVETQEALRPAAEAS
ncbi:hypothetical protein [Nonomuraea sp. NPDC049646]|uniref:hypothetical protein n=1 Tax=unclassified Nonomuraea TaxID=2593643 RepID=UPI0037B2706B